jgi:transposase
LFQLWPAQLQYLNDDRIGRCLERVALALDTNLVIETVSHVVREFNVRLDELHNDSTTITFFGDYAAADEERSSAGLATPAITWGHNKDHRPDLKQLLYILTVSDDGGIPVFFQTASGNVTDDQTHQATWKLMAELVQRPDFLYVADCKLATTENMNAIHRQDGRFITVLPATRKEDTEFRRTLRDRPESVTWREAYRLTHDDGSVRDLFRVCTDEQVSKEGFRVLWFHSQGKAESDAAARARRLQRAIRELTDLRERLRGPRTRLRERGKVQAAVDAILDGQGVAEWLLVELREQEEATYRQAGRGRPTAATKYRREVKMRFEIVWQRQEEALRLAESGDGVFPLITNVTDWPAADVLRAYKRQPVIEKRFSQLKSQFGVAPVYLKNVRRIMGLLAVYFFALMLASLLERELRLSMGRSGLASIPLYPEGRRCVRPTLRQVLDVFEPITRQTLWETGRDALTIFRTELAPIHCTVLRLLGVPTSVYRA